MEVGENRANEVKEQTFWGVQGRSEKPRSGIAIGEESRGETVEIVREERERRGLWRIEKEGGKQEQRTTTTTRFLILKMQNP
ncbi:hypothetical protein DY000_02051472 [Brassica cretica]|uniref:Uncharacterized protein n=1 Tax=Brassica cretica TaxID=69181 RepID=A0ABQ7F7W9_BRACR|nr:hypothetical protein DY000_02051472 [Brassica cretica]